MVVGILSYNFSVTLPILVEKAMHGSDADFSLVYAAFSAGAVVGTLVIARRTRVSLRAIIVSTAVFGLSMFALAAVPNIAVTYPVAALVGGDERGVHDRHDCACAADRRAAHDRPGARACRPCC